MREQLALVPPPEKTAATVFVNQIEGAEETIPPASLIGSMAKDGQITPIIVEYLGPVVGHEYRVVAGRRRLAAARHLGWEEIDAVIYDEGDINPAEIGLIENAMRSPNPMSEWSMIARLESEGLTDTEITQRTGMASATIQKRRQLGALTSGAAKAVLDGRVAVGVAEDMAKLPADLQLAVLADHPEGRITAKDVRAARETQQQAAWGVMTFDIPGITTPPHWKTAAISHLEAAMSVIPIEGADLTLLIAKLKELIEREGQDADLGSA